MTNLFVWFRNKDHLLYGLAHLSVWISRPPTRDIESVRWLGEYPVRRAHTEQAKRRVGNIAI